MSLSATIVIRLLEPDLIYEITSEKFTKEFETISVMIVIEDLLVRNVHHLMRNYQCEHCNERFGQLQNMIVHQVNGHQVHFMCSQCHQLYSNTPNAGLYL